MRRRARRLLHLWGCSSPSLRLGGGSERSHSETWAGCIVPLTTPTRSSLKASRSVSSLSLAEKAPRGCYELGPERLTNAENRARRRTDLTEKAAFPCGLFAEFITLSSRVWAELAKERFVTRRYRSVPPAGSRNLPRMTVLPLTDLM